MWPSWEEAIDDLVRWSSWTFYFIFTVLSKAFLDHHEMHTQVLYLYNLHQFFINYFEVLHDKLLVRLRRNGESLTPLGNRSLEQFHIFCFVILTFRQNYNAFDKSRTLNSNQWLFLTRLTLFSYKQDTPDSSDGLIRVIHISHTNQ